MFNVRISYIIFLILREFCFFLKKIKKYNRVFLPLITGRGLFREVLINYFWLELISESSLYMERPGTSRSQLPSPLLKLKNSFFHPFLTTFGRSSCVFIKWGTYKNIYLISFKNKKMTYFYKLDYFLLIKAT